MIKLSAAVADFLKHCKESDTFSPLTLRGYGSDLNYFLRFLGDDLALDAIRDERLLHYKKHLIDESGLQLSSIKRRITALKALLQWLEQQGRIDAALLRNSDLRIESPPRPARGLFPRARLYH